jgi:hypothetical protein
LIDSYTGYYEKSFVILAIYHYQQGNYVCTVITICFSEKIINPVHIVGLQWYTCLTVWYVSRYRPYDTIHIIILGKTLEEKTNEQYHLF